MNNIGNRFIRSRLIFFTLCWISVGSYKVNGQTFYQCMACPAGTYQDGNECRSCPEGHFCVGGIKEECDYGTYQPDEGKSSCLQCQPYYWSYKGAAKCGKMFLRVAYGLNYFNYRDFLANVGTIYCENLVFGDPEVGEQDKGCYIKGKRVASQYGTFYLSCPSIPCYIGWTYITSEDIEKVLFFEKISM